MNRSPCLVEAVRQPGPDAETRHAGAIAVADGSGQVIASTGDIHQRFPLRSTEKPFQLLPFLMEGLHLDHPRGAAELKADLAVMMASHGGEPMHTRRVGAILDAYGVPADALLCGAHWPYYAPARDALVCAGRSPELLHSNCSGKHAGMLAVCRRRDWPLETYVDPEHPLQRRIHDVVASLARDQEIPLTHSTDGCSLPTHWVSMRGLAVMYAGLASPGGAAPVNGRDVGEELALLFSAGVTHPEMVAGTGRFDTRLMLSFGGRVFGKTGAAGVYAMAVAPTKDHPSGLGISFKIEDGDGDARARPVVACEILRQLGIEPARSAPAESLIQLANADIQNVRGMHVGEYRPVFELSSRP